MAKELSILPLGPRRFGQHDGKRTLWVEETDEYELVVVYWPSEMDGTVDLFSATHEELWVVIEEHELEICIYQDARLRFGDDIEFVEINSVDDLAQFEPEVLQELLELLDAMENTGPIH